MKLFHCCPEKDIIQHLSHILSGLAVVAVTLSSGKSLVRDAMYSLFAVYNVLAGISCPVYEFESWCDLSLSLFRKNIRGTYFINGVILYLAQ